MKDQLLVQVRAIHASQEKSFQAMVLLVVHAQLGMRGRTLKIDAQCVLKGELPRAKELHIASRVLKVGTLPLYKNAKFVQAERTAILVLMRRRIALHRPHSALRGLLRQILQGQGITQMSVAPAYHFANQVTTACMA